MVWLCRRRRSRVVVAVTLVAAVAVAADNRDHDIVEVYSTSTNNSRGPDLGVTHDDKPAAAVTMNYRNINSSSSHKLSITNVCGLQGKLSRCAVDTSSFGFDNFGFKSDSGKVIDIDFGPKHRYTCRSHDNDVNHDRDHGGRGDGLALSGTCVSLLSSLEGRGDGTLASASISISNIIDDHGNGYDIVVGDMNIITRGQIPHTGEPSIFGSTTVGGEICNFSPDASGSTIVVECKSEFEYPPESMHHPAINEDDAVDNHAEES